MGKKKIPRVLGLYAGTKKNHRKIQNLRYLDNWVKQ